ncbi:type II toxin-antitoxin system HipA family toxin [Leifsonia sp. Leaf264]|uniref:type II toxin-antitoxin system HipA family toxin n=1 Tax=Leifsonia sp. Leaf264 TaxID=1736314 RepID=UPI0006FE1934|nr:HipA domain-containing protein [Leifsonia sp. Leaf264]KQO98454.1 phosphatidylinositol kinase [Leifsonia sp. Leaf264]
MTSEQNTGQPTEAFVWVWTPGASDPVVAGLIERIGDTHFFTYGGSYPSLHDAVPLYLPELPLTNKDRIRPLGDLTLAGCLADGAPDAWGRRVVLARRLGKVTRETDVDQLDILTYMLESGSDRFGAIDFQASAREYVPRQKSASLEELQTAAERLEAGTPLTTALGDALVHGTSIGGARPKALIHDNGRHMIAKFSSITDTYPVVKAEAVAMDLARRVGLSVAPTTLTRSAGKDVLLVERFDRVPGTTERIMAVSALTMLGLGEMNARYATYTDLADLIRARFASSRDTRELFARIVFNIAVGNFDDHARNHAALWDGKLLSLSPAYDICPQPRSGETAFQAMAIGVNGERESQFRVCVDAAPVYGLTSKQARDIIDHQVEVIHSEWSDAADAAQLTEGERQRLWGRQILNPFASYDY